VTSEVDCQKTPIFNPSDGAVVAHNIWVVSAVRRGFFLALIAGRQSQSLDDKKVKTQHFPV